MAPDAPAETLVAASAEAPKQPAGPAAEPAVGAAASVLCSLLLPAEPLVEPAAALRWAADCMCCNSLQHMLNPFPAAVHQV